MEKATPATYQDGELVYHANTCEPLEAAQRRGELQAVAWSHGSYPGVRMPESFMPELRSLGYWDAAHDQKWGLDWHRNEGLEITYLAKGKVAFAVENHEKVLLRAGDLTITRPWQPHRVGQPEVTASRLYWVILDVGVRQPHSSWRWPDWLVLSKSDLRDLNRLLQLNEDPVLSKASIVGECMERMVHTLAEGNPVSRESRLKLFLNELFICVLDLLRTGKRTMDESLIETQRTVQLFVNALPNYLDVPWTLPLMAKECELGRTRFSHYFTQLTNQTPLDYLGALRIQAAEKFLKETDTSIAEIARKCGFSSSQYFATQFKKKNGVPPGQFRDQTTKPQSLV